MTLLHLPLRTYTVVGGDPGTTAACALFTGLHDVANVEGHTDRLGSEACNQALSTRRAEAVRQYLITSGALATARVSATGRGESQPVTKAGDCVG